VAMGLGQRTLQPARAPRWTIGTLSALPIEDRALFVAAPVAAGIVLGLAAGITSVTALATLAALVTALVAPYAGLAILAFMGPLIVPSLVPAPGFATALVGSILLGCIYRLPLDRPRLHIGIPMLLMLALVVFVTVQQLPEMLAGYSSLADHGVGYLYFQLLTGFGAVIAAVWVLDGRSPFPILAMALAGAVTAALIALVPFVAPTFAGALARVSGPPFDLVRAVGTFSNPNFMGGSAAISMVAAVGLMAGAESRRVRAILLGCAVILGAAAIISLSRGALITALVGLVFVGLTRSRRTAIAVGLAGLAGALVIYPAFVEWRLINLAGSVSADVLQATAESDSNRLGGALAGVSLFLSSPLVGVGFGHYLANAQEIPGVVASAHNWYTYLLGEQGIVGAFLFASILATVAFKLLRLPDRPRTLGVSVLAAFATACLFLEIPTSFQTFAIPAIVTVSAFAGEWPSRLAVESAARSPALVPTAANGGLP
jgi:hypothetical protein